MNKLNKWLENYLLHLEHNNLKWLIKLKYLNNNKIFQNRSVYGMDLMIDSNGF